MLQSIASFVVSKLCTIFYIVLLGWMNGTDERMGFSCMFASAVYVDLASNCFSNAVNMDCILRLHVFDAIASYIGKENPLQKKNRKQYHGCSTLYDNALYHRLNFFKHKFDDHLFDLWSSFICIFVCSDLYTAKK